MYISKIFVTVDCVVLTSEESGYQILLIKRKNEPYKDSWALPGGFVDENEALEVAAARELEEETSIKATELLQIGAFGKPFRDPRSHIVSIAYFTLLKEKVPAKAQDDAKEVGWFSINNLPLLAFDHAEIISTALNKFINDQYI
ncbi:NUDIX hydrolase [Flavobacterium sp. NKUCC04_CG]|uniref:NUDIX domain-containing protein n=1 Tax=Flavobacterium sp. NKUCC04_CG TaxID=2842121 RepID=UPI001C5BB40E|nr:NUDIX hydrolase [Flavobacterium sp. NKUCC04_CG]MBW3518696.1 NUDIX hydrolase [Flavobacterium sp. NKUCC04_CG]